MVKRRYIGDRRRDNPVSVYFNPDVMRKLVNYVEDHPHIESVSRLVETLTDMGIDRLRQYAEAGHGLRRVLEADQIRRDKQRVRRVKRA